MTASAAQPLVSRTATALTGSARVPGDKSISHRSLMLGALAVGETEIHGLLEGEDVLRTAAAMRQLGGEAERGADGVWRARGRGIGGLREAPEVLDLGNAGAVPATVCWARGAHAGLAFHAPFDVSLLAKVKPQVAEHAWVKPEYLEDEDVTTSPWASEWGRLTVRELKRTLG